MHPAFELTELDLSLARDHLAAVGGLELRLERTHGLTLDGFLRHVRRQPAGVLDHQPDEPAITAQRLDVERPELESRRDECLPDRELRVRRDLTLEELRRDVRPAVHEVPAAELEPAELVVLE